MKLEEKAHTKNDIVPELKIGNDMNSNLNKKDKEKKKVDDLSDTYKPRIPLPSVLEVGSSSKKQRTRNEELMELFKQVDINLPLLDAIQHVSSYAKFLKELYTQKCDPCSMKKVVLSKDVSAILLNQLP